MSRIDRLTNERTTVRPEPAEQKPGDAAAVPLQLGHGDAAVAVRSGDHLHRRQPGAEVDGPRPLVPADQPRPDHQHRSRSALDHGRGRQGHPHRQARRRRLVRQHRHARGIGGAAGRRVGRQRRRRGQRDAGCGQDVDERHGEDLRRAEVDLRLRRAAVARRRPAPRTSRSTAIAAATTTPTSFATTDFGATWRSIAGNLPKGEVVRGLAEDRKNADVLYLGTETGLWVSLEPRRAVDARSRPTCRRCRSTRSSSIRATTT